MKKNVYSLVLSEDVVARIDRLAYQKGSNRSGLINQILAEYVSYQTPEARMEEVFSRIGALLETQSSFRVLSRPSDTIFSLHSPLVYKYNPTVRYQVVLAREQSPFVGELRVGFRTQNRELIAITMRFYRLWMQIEGRYLPGCEYAVSDGKWTRRLALRRSRSNEMPGNETLGNLIAAYIRVFDIALKAYFECHADSELAFLKIDALYRNYLESNTLIL